nr:hypothetical protein [Lacticaseibacillus sharpeae]
MRVKITDGVHLSVVPTDQFKTTYISVNFLAPLQRATIGARTLLTSLLEMSSAATPPRRSLPPSLRTCMVPASALTLRVWAGCTG